MPCGMWDLYLDQGSNPCSLGESICLGASGTTRKPGDTVGWDKMRTSAEKQYCIYMEGKVTSNGCFSLYLFINESS